MQINLSSNFIHNHFSIALVSNPIKFLSKPKINSRTRIINTLF